jgi:hypothetical protein
MQMAHEGAPGSPRYEKPLDESRSARSRHCRASPGEMQAHYARKLARRCCDSATKLRAEAATLPVKFLEGRSMTDRISPRFHAEIIVLLFDEHQDLQKVMERVGILLSDASAEHIEAVGKYLPIDVMRVLPRRTLRAA